LNNFSDPHCSELLVSAREAFTSGMQIVAVISAILLIVVAILAATFLRHIHPSGETILDETDHF
jgi:DHA2 family multidrug resistance protein-like MFS transporter